MTESLLPSGCYDVLHPQAGERMRMLWELHQCFDQSGYMLVNPPLLEFSDALLQDGLLSDQVFRVMDPHALKVMGIRADMTGQIARIASSRLKDAPRPLKLSYQGDVLHMRGDGLSGKRQFTQAGIELIGDDSAEAEAEVIMLAIKALAVIGCEAITLDLHLPVLVPLLLEHIPSSAHEIFLNALLQKDSSQLEHMDYTEAHIAAKLLKNAGSIHTALTALESAALPAPSDTLIARLRDVLTLLESQLPAHVTLTLDALESGVCTNYTGIAFSLFSPNIASEIARGGRYVITGNNEPACGFSLYVDTVKQDY